MKTRPALGPKGLIVLASFNLVCRMPLFSQARLLLVITVHDILPLLCSALHSPVAVPGHCTPARDVIHRAQYGIVPALRHDSQNLR